MLTFPRSSGWVLFAVALGAHLMLLGAAPGFAQQTTPGTPSSDFVLGQDPKTSTTPAKTGFGQEPQTSGSATGSATGTTTTGTTTTITSAGFGLDPTSTASQGLRQSDPGFLVRADVDRALRSYREGDPLSITVAAEADAYVYVLYKQADGQIFQVFPNNTHPDNLVKARQAVQIPARDDTYRWVVGAPFGKEVIKVLASKEPLTELADARQRRSFFNPVSTVALKGVQLELGKQSRQWAEQTVEITTYGASQAQEQPGARRFALFVGLGQYEHIAKVDKTSDGKEATIYQPGHRDARTLNNVLQEVGKLNETKVLTNDQATRANVEQAMTSWLPSVSRPGDTVLVYFSGQAMTVAQAAGTQDSGVVLPLYEFMPAARLQTLRKARSEGKLSSALAAQLNQAEQLAAQGGTGAVVRRWGITDDLFAYWLQGLSGREVIVLLDAPYASAFAPSSTSSDPLAGGVSRLKSLGHQEVALLGASGEQRADVYRDPQGLSMMTELLVKSISAADGPLSFDEAQQNVAKALEQRLESINQSLRAAGKSTIQYRPYVLNTCSRQVYLKP